MGTCIDSQGKSAKLEVCPNPSATERGCNLCLNRNLLDLEGESQCRLGEGEPALPWEKPGAPSTIAELR